MRQVKQFLGGRLSLRNYNAQVGVTFALTKALNKLREFGMPEAQYRRVVFQAELRNKACSNKKYK